MTKIAILASGSGTNAENIFHYFRQRNIVVELIITDNATAGVITRAAKMGVECLVANRKEIGNSTAFAEQLLSRGIRFIILAGYLGQIGTPLLQMFPQRILNIHPALLPRYGGKGMYGHHVHEAVISGNDTLSGITVHIIDGEYDKGITLCQATCPVFRKATHGIEDTADTLAQRIHRLEYIYYPVVIEDYITRFTDSATSPAGK